MKNISSAIPISRARKVAPNIPFPPHNTLYYHSHLFHWVDEGILTANEMYVYRGFLDKFYSRFKEDNYKATCEFNAKPRCGYNPKKHSFTTVEFFFTVQSMMYWAPGVHRNTLFNIIQKLEHKGFIKKRGWLHDNKAVYSIVRFPDKFMKDIGKEEI